MENKENVSKSGSGEIGRRGFLGTVAAAIVVPYVIPGSSLGLAGTVAPTTGLR